MNGINIVQGELSNLENMNVRILDTITAPPYDKVYGIKREKYYIINSNTRINNPENTMEGEYLNQFLQTCAIKGFSLIMIKF